MLEVALTPSGHLILAEASSAGPVGGTLLPETVADSLLDAFKGGQSTLLLRLATLQDKAVLPPTFTFWRRLGERYLTELCHIPEPAEDLKQPLPPPIEELAEIAATAPPMRGGEYLRTETLAAIWKELDAAVRGEIAAMGSGLGEWLRLQSPLWHRVGWVCFHLAENKRDPECPFAFLATYAPKLLDGGRVQYQPLGRALEEYAGTKNKKMLVKRKQIVDNFQREGGPPFMVLSLKAGGTGLNLTAATHVIHFDRWWNPAVENQATDRAFRIGQTRNVMVHKFVCQGTIEEKIDALIRDKTALAGEILEEGVPKLVTEMSDGELLNLVRLDITRATED